MLLITHDPHLVELVADQLWLVDGGTVRPYDGDMDEYRVLLAKKGRAPKLAGAAKGGNKKEERKARAAARAQAAA